MSLLEGKCFSLGTTGCMLAVSSAGSVASLVPGCAEKQDLFEKEEGR